MDQKDIELFENNIELRVGKIKEKITRYFEQVERALISEGRISLPEDDAQP